MSLACDSDLSSSFSFSERYPHLPPPGNPVRLPLSFSQRRRNQGRALSVRGGCWSLYNIPRSETPELGMKPPEPESKGPVLQVESWCREGRDPTPNRKGLPPTTGLMPFLHLLALSINALALGPKPSLLFSALGCWDWDPESTFLSPPAPSWALQIKFFSSRCQRALVKIQEDCILHLFHLEAVKTVDPRSHMGSGDSFHTPGAASAYPRQRKAPTSQLQRFP